MKHTNDLLETFLNYNLGDNFKSIPPIIKQPTSYFEILKNNILSETYSCTLQNSNNNIYDGIYHNYRKILIIKNFTHDVCVRSFLISINNTKYIITSDLNFSSTERRVDAMVKTYPVICSLKIIKIKFICDLKDYILQYKSLNMLEKTYRDNKVFASILDPSFCHPGVYIDKKYDLSKCDKSQLKTIMSLKNSIECIHGSAGTGKSSTIFNIISKRIPDNHTVLCTAVQNQAINALAEKFITSNVSFIAFGNYDEMGCNTRKYIIDEIYKKNPLIIKTSKSLNNWKNFYTLLLSKNIDEWIDILCKNHLTKLVIKSENEITEYIESYIRKLEDKLEKMKSDIISNNKIFLATIASIHKLPIRYIDTIIVDEASSVTEMIMPSFLITNPSNLILIGDHKQLPGFTRASNKIIKKIKHNTSYLERSLSIAIQARNYHMLTTQYRMSFRICNMVSDIFYENKLQSISKKNDLTSLIWFNTNEEELKENTSYCNPGEIEYIKKLILLQPLDNLMIISPYNRQIDILNKTFINDNISIKTIDSSQGSEKDIVIISLVRSNKSSSVGFLYNLQRLCVMLSRAMSKLWIVGNYSMFYNSKHTIWKSIISHFTIVEANMLNDTEFKKKLMESRIDH